MNLNISDSAIFAKGEAKRTNPEFYRVLSFGYLPMIVDLIWVRAVTDSETTRYKIEEGHSAQFYAFSLLTELDPAFFSAYWVGGNLLAIARDDVTGAVELLNRGMKFLKEEYPSYPEEFKKMHWSGAWYIPYFLGYVHLFELKDLPTAASILKYINDYPGAPLHWSNVAKKLEKPDGIYELGLNFINHLIITAQTQEIADRLQKRRRDLLLSHHLFRVNNSFKEFLKKKSTHASQISWNWYVKETQISLQDPLGGKIYLDPQGRVVSTTPREKVFGLD